MVMSPPESATYDVYSRTSGRPRQNGCESSQALAQISNQEHDSGGNEINRREFIESHEGGTDTSTTPALHTRPALA